MAMRIYMKKQGTGAVSSGPAPIPTTQFFRTIDSSTNDQFYGNVLDGSAIYGLGRTQNGGSPTYYGLVSKLDLAGNTIWNARYYSSTGTDFNFYDGAADGQGNIYSVGYSNESGSRGVVIKTSSSGNIVWQKVINGTHSYLTNVVYDSGNVYVAGYINDGNSTDGLLIKFDSNGNVLMQKRYTLGSQTLVFRGLTIAPNGDIYTSGYGTNTNLSIIITKINSTGSVVWSRSYTGPGHSYNFGVVYDSVSDSIYVTGLGGTTTYGGYLLKYDTTGTMQWHKYITAPTGSIRFYKTAVSNGNIYTSGHGNTTDDPANNEVQMFKFDSSGNMLFQRYIGTTSFADYSSGGIRIDTDQNVYVSGYDGNQDGIIAKVNDVLTNYTSGNFHYDSASNNITTGPGSSSVFSSIVVETDTLTISPASFLFSLETYINSGYTF